MTFLPLTKEKQTNNKWTFCKNKMLFAQLGFHFITTSLKSVVRQRKLQKISLADTCKTVRINER